MTQSTCHVLDEDPELGTGIEGARLEAARQGLWAVTVDVEPEHFDPEAFADVARGGLGLLVLDGLLIRRVGPHARRSAEVLGPGDVLRPWEQDPGDLSVEWRILQPSRLAVLDRGFAQRAAAHPEVIGALIGRAVSRARALAALLAILHHPRVERRLLLLLWLLAERWGRVTPKGVVLPLPLTHEVLAELVGARRPSVTSCLGALTQRGAIRRSRGGWVLLGDPPEHTDAADPAVA
jgi:CRP/FNR family transcriptional regulator, cyclic AMP receptor protein